LRGREAEVHFEADEIGVGAGVAWEPAEVVLAGGEEDLRRGERVAGGGDAPEIAGAMQGLGGVAAEDECAGGGGALEESFVEGAAGEGLRGEGEGRGGDAERAGETDVVDGDGAECGEVEAEVIEAGDGFGGEEVAADFVVRGEGAFEEGDAAAGAGELDGSGGACGATADDDGVEVGGQPASPRLKIETWGTRSCQGRECHRGSRTRATQRRFMGCCSMVAEGMLVVASMRCQSAGTKARRSETGPSC